MKPDPGPPTIVSLESHRRRRLAQSREKAVQARKARRGSSPKAINWRRAPLALAVILGFMAASWLIGRLLH